MGSKSLPPLTDSEAQRIEAAKERGCIACLIRGAAYPCGAVEYHHLLVGGLRAGHRFGVALGAWHHRGETNLKNAGVAEHYFGPSLARGSVAFHAAFGSDQELLDYQNELIGAPLEQLPARAERRVESKCTKPDKVLARRTA